MIVTSVNTAPRSTPSPGPSDQGGIIDNDMPIHASNVMLVHKGKPARTSATSDSNGNKVRVAKLGGARLR